MLRPHPAVLRRLVEEYEALLAVDQTTHGSMPSPRAQDLAYTLCVSTGTRDVRQALQAAHRWLSAADPAAARGPLTGATSGAE
ncbi:DUF5133 domain-containing protein [Streptomyces sp. NPDC048751]|uniref:DUF5133 domain-containing protein n=1 Tax=Streptomyces sp. NPDC048751 TaxID=3365591 RepID=UPI00371E8E05